MASRVAGLVREMAIGAFLGASTAAEAYRAALRIPNLLQNLLGEGVLSASFIPVYARLLEEREPAEARKLAGAVLGLLTAVTGVLVVIGVALARPIIWILTAGLLPDDVFEAAVPLVRIMTVGIGFLVLSAWCLGVLNTHRRFLLSYASPVAWNLAQIVALVVTGTLGWAQLDIGRALAWAVVVGGLLQFLVQLPTVRSVAPEIRPNLDRSTDAVKEVFERFVPTLLGRGVVQLSSYLDLLLAAALAQGALSVLGYAQVLYLLPVSLFAMSVAAAELPEMSRLAGDPDALVARARRGQARIAFFLVFVAAAYFALGDLIVATLYQSLAGFVFRSRAFSGDLTMVVWFVLATRSLGLPANGLSRLTQNSLYAVGDTKGPARIAFVRVAVAAVVGLVVAFQFDRVLIEAQRVVDFWSIVGLRGPLARETRSVEDVFRLGAVGLAVGSAVGAWVELVLLQRLLRRHLPGATPPTASIARLAVPGAIAFLVAATAKLVTDPLPTLIATALSLGLAGLTYVVVAFRLQITEADLVLRPVRRLLWRS